MEGRMQETGGEKAAHIGGVSFSTLSQYHQDLLTKRIRDNEHNVFPQGNHKGENPATSSKIELAPKQ